MEVIFANFHRQRAAKIKKKHFKQLSTTLRLHQKPLKTFLKFVIQSDDMNKFDHCGLVESSISYLFYILLKNTKKKSSDDGYRNFLNYTQVLSKVLLSVWIQSVLGFKYPLLSPTPKVLPTGEGWRRAVRRG